MKITIYELLGLVKDGKAPKKVLVGDNWYEYNHWGNDYNDINMPSNYWLFQDYTFGSNGNRLNEEIEIIEEENKIPEKIEQIMSKRGKYNSIDELAEEVLKAFETIDDLIINQNQLIDYLKSKGE